MAHIPLTIRQYSDDSGLTSEKEREGQPVGPRASLQGPLYSHDTSQLRNPALPGTALPVVPLQLGPGAGPGRPDRALPPPTERRPGGPDGGPADRLWEKGEPPNVMW